MKRRHAVLFLIMMIMTIFIANASVSPEVSSHPRLSGLKNKYVINDFTLYSTPSIAKPEKGIAFKDSLFYCDITRITDAAKDVPGQKYNYAFPGYPKHDIENADGTKLIIQSFSGSCWAIWNANPPYNKIGEISASLIGWCRPIDARWDANDPNVIYFYQDTRFFKYNVSTGKSVVLHNFSIDFNPPTGTEFQAVTMSEKGTPSVDSRYWAFIIIYFNPKHSPQWWHYAMIVYDKDYYGTDKGKIISRIDETNPNFKFGKFVSMSASGKYVYIGDWQWVYPRDLSSVKKIPLESGHQDLAYSKEGREVIFGFALKDGSWSKGYWASMVDIETGKLTYLVPIGSPRYHFSGRCFDKPGWGVMSTYFANHASESEPGVENTWGDYEVFMVELTTRSDPKPRVWRLAKTHTLFKSYADAPFAKINKKGTKVWFGSGWGKSLIDGPYDVYQINLPSTWYQDLK